PGLTARLDGGDRAAGRRYLAWRRNNRKRPGHYDADVRQGGGRPVKVNARGTQGWIGGISGTTLFYQQAFKRHSDLNFFELTTHRRTYAAGFNTRSWEWHPSISGDWVLFGRSAADTDYMILRSVS